VGEQGGSGLRQPPRQPPVLRTRGRPSRHDSQQGAAGQASAPPAPALQPGAPAPGPAHLLRPELHRAAQHVARHRRRRLPVPLVHQVVEQQPPLQRLLRRARRDHRGAERHARVLDASQHAARVGLQHAQQVRAEGLASKVGAQLLLPRAHAHLRSSSRAAAAGGWGRRRAGAARSARRPEPPCRHSSQPAFPSLPSPACLLPRTMGKSFSSVTCEKGVPSSAPFL
jgi:hypothetical protein